MIDNRKLNEVSYSEFMKDINQILATYKPVSELDKAMQGLATTAQLMRLLNVSNSTINNYVREGMPRVKRNCYDLAACWQWLKERDLAKKNKTQSL
jgi:hypothetical protein